MGDAEKIGKMAAALEAEKKKTASLTEQLAQEKESSGAAGEEMSSLEEKMSKKMDDFMEDMQQKLAVAMSLSSGDAEKTTIASSAPKAAEIPTPTPHPAPAAPVAAHTAAPTGGTSSSSRFTQAPTPAPATMLDAQEELLTSQLGLDPIVTQDPKYAKLLDYRRYRLAPTRMGFAATVSVDKIKHYFPLTTRCVNGGPFDGNGPEPEKLLAGSVLTFLKCLTVEAYASNLTEGDLQRGMTYLVGPNVANGLMQEGLKPTSRVHSYCGQVSWLLQTYAKEKDLRLAESRLGTIRQAPDESPRSYQERLVSSMGHLKSDEELKNQFIFGVGLGAQASLTALNRDFTSTWDNLISAAEAGDYGPRTFAASSSRARRTVNLVAEPVNQSGIMAPAVDPTPFVDSEEDVEYSAPDEIASLLKELLLVETRHFQKKDIVCYLCFEPGHVVADCKMLPPDKMKILLERRANFLAQRQRQRPYSRNPSRIPRMMPSSDRSASGLPRLPPRSAERRQDF